MSPYEPSSCEGLELKEAAWVEKGGVVGRGVLLDYAAWADSQGLSPAIFEPTSITVSTLEAIATHQQVTLRKGDILFIRSGYIRAYDKITPTERQALADMATPPAIGVESSEETLKWLWENSFSAVVGDQPSFEAWPCQDPKFWLHEWCLAGWGLTLGELFDLEGLSKECEKRKRWTFFFSSMPLRVSTHRDNTCWRQMLTMIGTWWRCKSTQWRSHLLRQSIKPFE